MCQPSYHFSIKFNGLYSIHYVIQTSKGCTFSGGEAVPIMVYNPSDDSNKFYEVSDQTLMWQGTMQS